MIKKPAHKLNERWRSEDVKASEKVPFSSFLLKEKLLAGLRKAGFMYASPVQLETLSMGLYAKDLIIQAKAGTGKTLVFAIIALEHFRPDVKTPQALILAPTREVAVQNCNVIKAIGSKLHATCRTFIGGMSVSDDMENSDKCQIVVGTPGRIRHLVNSGHINTQYIRLFVLDEADQLVQGMFKEEIDEIFQSLPTEKQVIATSATYPDNLTSFSKAYFRNPHFTRLNTVDPCLLGITHYGYLVKCGNATGMEYKCKLKALDNILSRVTFAQCLIFCNSVAKVDTLCADITHWGFSTISISSAKEQISRLKALEDLQKFRCKILVSSDLSSRGIDAENVDLIINFDVPYESTIYVNRVGRAGRFGTKGVAITIITEKQAFGFSSFQKAAKFTSYALTEPIPKNLLNMRPIATAPDESISSANKIYESFKQRSVLAMDSGTSFKNKNKLKNIEHQENVCHNEIPSEEEENLSIDKKHDLAANSQEVSDGEVVNVPENPHIFEHSSTVLDLKVENEDIEEDCGENELEHFGDNGSDTKDLTNELDDSEEASSSDREDLEVDTPVSVENIENGSSGLKDRSKNAEILMGNDEVLSNGVFTSQCADGVKNSPCSPKVQIDVNSPIEELVADYEACTAELDLENGTSDKDASTASNDDSSKLEISLKDVTEIRTSRESFFHVAIKAYQNDAEAAKAKKNEMSENCAISSDLKNIVASSIDSERSLQQIETSIPRKVGTVDASGDHKNVSFADKKTVSVADKRNVSTAEEKSATDPQEPYIYISSYDEEVYNPLVAYRELRNADHLNDESRLRMLIRKKKWELKCAQRKVEDLEKSIVEGEYAGDGEKTSTKTKKKKQRKSMNAMPSAESTYQQNFRYEDENIMKNEVRKFRPKKPSKINELMDEKPKHHAHKIKNEKHRAEREEQSHQTRQKRKDSKTAEHHPNYDENEMFKRHNYHNNGLRNAHELDVAREFSESHFRRQKGCKAVCRRPESYNTRCHDHKCCHHYTRTDQHTHWNAAGGPTFSNSEMYPIWQDLFNFQNQFILAHCHF